MGIKTRATIVIYGVNARLEGIFPLPVVIDHTSYYKQGYKFTQKYRQGFWDGRVKLFNRKTQMFPAGLVPFVKEVLEENDVIVSLDDKRNMPPVCLPTGEIKLHGVSFDYPYDFQIDCMNQMIEKQRGIVSAATNSGKTEISCLVTAALKVPTLFLVPGKELLYQTQERFAERLGIGLKNVGIIGDSKWKPNPWITISTVASIYQSLGKPRGKEFLDTIDLLFSDECHKVGSDSYYLVLMSCNAFYRFGLSGTALHRSDGADLRLIAATGPVIYEVRNKFLIERGISSEVDIHFVPIKQPIIPDGTPWQDAYKAGIVDNIARNRKLCSIANYYVNQDRKVLMLIREIEHGKQVDERLWTFKQQSFIPHQFINGQESTEVRQQAIKDFKCGKLKILISSSIIDEGVDIPSIDVLILGGSGKSTIKTLQRVGRGIRIGGKDNKLIVIDTADFQNKYLLEHSLQRLQDYTNEDCFNIQEWDDRDVK